MEARRVEAVLSVFLVFLLVLIFYTLYGRQNFLHFGIGHSGFDDIVLFISLAAAFVLLRRLSRMQARARAAAEAQIRSQARLIGFNRMLAEISQIIARAENDVGLFQKLCDVIVSQFPMKLAFITRPDAQKRFQIIAASGDTGYIDGIFISSDQAIPEGRGTISQSWNKGIINYNQSFPATAALSPWHERAKRFGIGASATLPLRRAGQIDAVLAVFDKSENIFDEALTILLPSLAELISGGIDRIALVERQRRTQVLNQTVLDNSIVGIALTADDKIYELNQRLINDLGASDPASLIGEPIMTFFSGITLPEPSATEAGAMPPERHGAGYMRRLDGTLFWATLTIRELHESPASKIWLIRDATAEHDIQAQLEYVALHDGLTTLPNRYAFEQYLPGAISRAKADNTTMAVGMLDLDEFKGFNDTYGHLAGDLLLRAFGERLNSQLSPGDFLARLGGDEFVMILSLARGETAITQLTRVMDRFETAFQQPFQIVDTPSITVGMTVGLALYPDHTTDGDMLMRLADAALYQIKTRKLTRSNWWSIAGQPVGDIEDGAIVAPYGDPTAALLLPLHSHLATTLDAEAGAFFSLLDQLEDSRKILSTLTDKEHEYLARRLIGHLLRMVKPDLGQAEHESGSNKLGRVHAMLGITSSDAIRLFTHYSTHVRGQIDQITLNPITRLRLNSVMQARLSNELQYEQQGRWQIDIERQENYSTIQENAEIWTGAGIYLEQVVRTVGALSGILGVAWGRTDERDHHVIEYGAGCAVAFVEELNADKKFLIFGASAPSKQPCTLRAWSSGEIEVTDNIKTDIRMTDLWAVSEKFGVRSACAIPAFDETGLPIAVFSILGAYPNQFSSPGARIWMRAVQRLLQGAYDRAAALPASPISVARRQSLRNALFTSGLRMMMQPIIDLRSGRLYKVEALARLEINGAIISPAEFLASFGSAELRHLFRRGLSQSLAFLALSEDALPGLMLGLNLPPTVLEAAECVSWVKAALDEHAIAPDRLWLELLETGDSHNALTETNDSIQALSALGVQLEMDDLGSGYSSLQRLRTLPFDSVKIDQNLIRQAESDPETTIPFIGGLIQMAHRLGLTVVAEGLETLDLIEMAACLDADYGQGYAFSRPMATSDVAPWTASFNYNVDVRNPTTALGRLARAERDKKS